MKPTDPLPHPDRFHLRAAVGWLELGAPEEARMELGQIRSRWRRHPDVQEVEWTLCARVGQWERCVTIANALIKAAPERPNGWIHLSYALHELQLTEDAFENLVGVVSDFPEDAIMRYNLACYCCQLGHRQEAMEWLRQAMQRGDASHILEMALGDQDLEPLWREIRRMS